MGFSRQEYWSGLPFPSPRNLPDPEIEPKSPASWVDALPSEPPRKFIFSSKFIDVKGTLRFEKQLYRCQSGRLTMGLFNFS